MMTYGTTGYKLTSTNTSGKTVRDVHVKGKTTGYAAYVNPAALGGENARCVTVPAGTACSVLQPEPNSGIGWTGNREWKLDQVNSNATGTLEYR